ncbi:MAG: hypothetical protein COB23_09485 [Methylophaga sp.]|nr:MAG: hypothetical protein COB23_09485 [Methylophaga sp.]
MNNIKVVLYHPSLDVLSDRTFRSLLKKLSVLLRELQAREVYQLIESSPLDLNEKQSIRDRIKPDLNHLPAYYVEKIERGSLDISSLVSGSALLLVSTVIAKVINDVLDRKQFYKDFIDYLSSDRRKEVMEKNIDIVIDNWSLDRYLIGDIQKNVDDSGDMNVKILLKTPDELEKVLKETEVEVDVDFVIKNSERILRELDSHDSKNR